MITYYLITMSDDNYKIILSNYKQAISEPNEYIKYYMDENNINIWYVILHNFTGDKNEYENCEFLVKIKIPASFPNNPPEFYFMTPNGVYETDAKVCISIGEFHSDNFRPVLGISGFVINLISGFIAWSELTKGIRLIKTSISEKKTLSNNSKEYNIKYNKTIIDLIENNYKEYSKNQKIHIEEIFSIEDLLI